MKELTFKQVMPLIIGDLRAGLTPTLLGEPGIGKSSLIEDLARIFKTKVFTLPVNQLGDKTDLTGVRMTKSSTGNYRQEAFPHSIIMDCIEYCIDHPNETPILFLDEFNRASSDITSAILSFQTLRKIGDIKFPDNMQLIVAGNDRGNITALDGASVSRFSLYKLRPDIETFLSVQTLNPFILDVLNQHPEDLMSPKLDTLINKTDNDNDDDDQTEMTLLMSLDSIDDEGFEQITRPRTITYTSCWLNAMGIDKSGSDEEKTILSEMLLNNAFSIDSENVLMAGIEAHVGETVFAQHLYEHIRTYFNTIINSNTSSTQAILSKLRPQQSIINALSRSNDTADTESIIESLNQKEKINTLIWLNEGINVKEINNNRAVQQFVQDVPYTINAFENDSLKQLISILVEPSKRSDMVVNELLKSNAPIMDQWKPVIKSMM